MNKFLIASYALLFSSMTFSQSKDTLYIEFDNSYDQMRKDDFTQAVQAGSPEEKLKRSTTYYIEQMESVNGYDFEFSFSHLNQSQKNYKTFGGKPPTILDKPKSFLKEKTVLDINFFRSTPYLKIAKTFEKEDRWEQDVVIFVVDVDEIKNDSIVLREVNFSRPVKQ
ncbi:hypothetical protein LZ575_16755 [Antarcticibacterium sp. 1MA-6-2]|uniref:hypothetical protein n=1 Tax=Antarcticibacterium sp. 1MA-6-2 TaxID=2908210 RepID=UPI001F451C9B|nr:hypothetical protein [Antarcticibacterium sp. 1MA-6-2]UJH90453.1 hypothetical protein LZ575_16755 [Antarcticibacterium sp. 1MA-6-2]